MGKRIMEWAIVFALITFFLWGSTNFLVKYGAENDMPRPQIVAVMWITIGVIGVIFLAYLMLTGNFSLKFDKWLFVPVAAGLLLGLGLLSFTYGVSEGSTGAIAAIATANSAFTTILAYVFLKEELTIVQTAGIGLVLAGLVLLVLSN